MTSLLVISIDDEAPIRDSLSILMDAYGYDFKAFQSLAEFNGIGLEAIALETRPVIILLDKNLKDADGVERIASIRDAAGPGACIIMVTGFGDVTTAVTAMQRGAVDFVEKPIDPDKLLAAIARAETQLLSVQADRSALEDLSAREIEVLQKLAQGKMNKTAAFELGISQRTIEVHRSNIMRKTGCENFAELVRLSIQTGLV